MPLLAKASLEHLVIQCSSERMHFRQTGEPFSPGCAEIFRRAVDEDQAAIAAIRGIFEPLMRAWIKGWRFVAEDADDVMQEGFWAFTRSAARHRECTENDDLSRALGLWETCVKKACIHTYRKNRKHRDDVAMTGTEALPASEQSIETRIVLNSRLSHLLKDTQEYLAVWSRFMLGFTPQQILDRYPDEFSDIKDVNLVLQRTVRRLRKDKVLRDLYSLGDAPTGLDLNHMSVIPQISGNEVGAKDMDTTCHLGNDVLLNYALGTADPSVKAIVERSAPCLSIARQMIAEIDQIQALFQSSACPPPEMVVQYYSREVAGTEFLLLARHIKGCALCNEEVALLTGLGAGPYTGPELRSRRRIKPVIEALYRSPLKQSLLGSAAAQYETRHALINIAVQKPSGNPRTWVLVGEIRQPDGLPFREVIQEVSLALSDNPEVRFAGSFDLDGGFMVEHLTSGIYALMIEIAQSDIVIGHIAVGDPI